MESTSGMVKQLQLPLRSPTPRFQHPVMWAWASAHTPRGERAVPGGHTTRLSQPGGWREGFADGRRDLRLHPSEGRAGLHRGRD